MDEETHDEADISTQQEETVDLDTTEEEDGYYQEEEAEDVEAIKARAEKAEELAKNYKIRAEKAEKLAKGKTETKEAASPKTGDMSSKDLYALMTAKVSPEDIDEVKDYASLKKISISEALKSSVIKSILSEKEEQRNVSTASNVGSSKRGSSKVSDETLLKNFQKNILPESDEDFERLAAIRNKR